MNVIPITDRDSISAAAPPRRLPVLHCARDAATSLLGDAFRHMLDQADDLLFGFAERAENNAQQTLYFDAMRELRLKRQYLHQIFLDGLASGFDRRYRRNLGKHAAVTTGGSTLSLLDDATVEEDITIAGLAERMANAAREELFGLNKRVAALMEVNDLSAEDNPLGPSCIAEAARDVANGLSAEMKIRLIVLKLFDRHVAANVPGVYAQVNRLLIGKGVLPTIQTVVRRQPIRTTGGAIATAAIPVGSTDALGMLTRLMNQNGLNTASGGAPVPLIPLSLGVMQALTELQQQATVLASNGDGELPNPRLLINLQKSGALPALGPAGDMTIDIVAMLFDYILEDKNVPEEIRSKLARLQIPILKVALIDRDFFSRKSHPARRLLNLIADSAVAATGDAITEKTTAEMIEKIVHRIVTEFDNDVSIFSRSLDALQRAMEQIKREANVRTSRTARLLDGRARLERAKEQARALLDTRLRPDGIPESVRNFLLTHWKHLLITLICNEGEESKSLGIAVRTMDELVWSTLPKRGVEQRQKLARLLPDLLIRVRNGMEFISMPKVARTGFLGKLEKTHADIMRGIRAAVPTPPEVATQPSPESIQEKGDNNVTDTAFEMLDVTTGEISGDLSEMLENETCANAMDERAEVSRAVVSSEAERRLVLPPSAPESAKAALWAPRAGGVRQAQHAATAPSSAMRILEEAKTAAEQLRARLASEDEVRLADVMPPASELPVPAPAMAEKGNSVLEITANTFYKLFAPNPDKPNGNPDAAATLNFEELTLGDTRNPAVPVPEDRFLQMVSSLEPGTWVELQREDGGVIQVKYAAFDPDSASYVFTDRGGRRVLERTLNGLVTDFRRGTARTVAEPPGIFDKAFTRLLDPSTWRVNNR